MLKEGRKKRRKALARLKGDSGSPGETRKGRKRSSSPDVFGRRGSGGEVMNALGNLSASDVALVLSASESTLTMNVGLAQLITCGWSKPHPRNVELAPDATLSVERFNQVSYWVARKVLDAADLSLRVGLVEYFILCATELRSLHNYNGLMEVIGGLNNVAVQRLRKTWAQLSEPTILLWEQMNDLMSTLNNYSAYRNALKAAPHTAVPFLGVVLRDMTFIRDGNELMYKKRFNMNAMRMIGEVLHSLNRFQIENVFSCKILPDSRATLEGEISAVPEDADDLLFERSVMIEPRESTSASSLVGHGASKRLRVTLVNTAAIVSIDMPDAFEAEDVFSAVSQAFLFVAVERIVFIQGRAAIQVTRSTMEELMQSGTVNDEGIHEIPLFVTAKTTVNFELCDKIILRAFNDKGKLKEEEIDPTEVTLTPQSVVEMLRLMWPGTCQAFYKRQLPNGSVDKTVLNKVSFVSFLSTVKGTGGTGELTVYVVREAALEKMKVY